MTDALWGFVGAVLGAAAGLIGTLASLRHARNVQAEEWQRETDEARLRQLKDAYVEYFSALQRMHGQVAETVSLAHGKDKNDPRVIEAALAMSRAWREQTALMGTRVRLLEADAEARQRSGDLLGLFSVALGKVTIDGQDLMNKLVTLNDVQLKVAEFEKWVVEVRFGSSKLVPVADLRKPKG